MGDSSMRDHVTQEAFRQMGLDFAKVFGRQLDMTANGRCSIVDEVTQDLEDEEFIHPLNFEDESDNWEEELDDWGDSSDEPLL